LRLTRNESQQGGRGLAVPVAETRQGITVGAEGRRAGEPREPHEHVLARTYGQSRVGVLGMFGLQARQRSGPRLAHYRLYLAGEEVSECLIERPIAVAERGSDERGQQGAVADGEPGGGLGGTPEPPPPCPPPAPPLQIHPPR